jgi:hypothetical protein
VVDVAPISIVHVQSLLHQKNIGVTYVGTSSFKMETSKIYAIILCGSARVYNYNY